MESQINQRKSYAVAPSRVMRAITDPDELAAWFGPRGVRVVIESVVLEPRVGGGWRFALEGDAERVIVDGTITAYAVPHLLEVKQQVAGATGLKHDIMLALHLELTETSAGTDLVVSHGPFPPAVLESANAMWVESLQRLEHLLTPPR